MRPVDLATRSLALLALLFMTASPLAAEEEHNGETAPAIAAPDVEPMEFLRQAVTRGIARSAALTEQEGSLTLEVNGEAMRLASRAVLVEPGDEVRLRAVVRPPRGLSTRPESRTSLDDYRGLLRQTSISEVLWEAEPDDILLPVPDGSVVWRAGASGGGVSYVSAQAAELRAQRGAGQIHSTGAELAAPAWSARAGVLLLSGVAFDRTGDGILHGQNVGIYPNERSGSAPRPVREHAHLYTPPGVFYRLDERTRDARILPHLTLGELMPAVFPDESEPEVRYVSISPRLLKFLEEFYAEWIAAGHDPRHVAVLRGFVSPTERLRLERRGVSLAEFSRFQYGDAVALVYDPRRTDEEERGAPPRMGDLTGDGEVTTEDAEVMAEIAKDTMDRIGMYGGLGIVESFQGPGPSEGTPYLHVDLRGWYTTFRE